MYYASVVQVKSMSAIQNSRVSVFEGVVKCATNGMYCSDYALCLHYSVSPHFRGVRREGFHCTHFYKVLVWMFGTNIETVKAGN